MYILVESGDGSSCDEGFFSCCSSISMGVVVAVGMVLEMFMLQCDNGDKSVDPVSIT